MDLNFPLLMAARKGLAECVLFLLAAHGYAEYAPDWLGAQRADDSKDLAVNVLWWNAIGQCLLFHDLQKAVIDLYSFGSCSWLPRTAASTQPRILLCSVQMMAWGLRICWATRHYCN